MNRQELMKKLAALPFPKNDYWLITGGAMVLYGMKPKTHDIDLGCTKALADRLEAEGHPFVRLEDGRRKFVLNAGEVELFEAWLYDRVETVEGFPVISIPGLIQMKETLGRPKDFADLVRIRDYLQSNVNHTKEEPVP